jgi:hypothetical protein
VSRAAGPTGLRHQGRDDWRLRPGRFAGTIPEHWSQVLHREPDGVVYEKDLGPLTVEFFKNLSASIRIGVESGIGANGLQGETRGLNRLHNH